MSVEFIWQLTTKGDARYGDATTRRRGERASVGRVSGHSGVSDPRKGRFNDFDYMHQVARAAELAGFDGLWIPHDLEGDDAFIVSGYVASTTRSVKIIMALEASWGSAVYAAKNAVSFQRCTGGRLAWQICAGADERTRRRHADAVPDVDVRARIDEFLTVARGVIEQHPFDFKGRFFEVAGGGFESVLANRPAPEVYLDGASPEALDLSARLADVHVFDAREPTALAGRIAELGALAVKVERQRRAPLSYGVRLEVLARETDEEARFDAERRATQRSRAGDDDAATLVGSYAHVAERLAQYAELGVTRFLLGASPHLEEAYRIGAHVLPDVRNRIGARSVAA